MKRLKSWIFAGALFLRVSALPGQQFMRTIVDPEADHNHYSVTPVAFASGVDQLILTGTRYHESGVSDCHVMRMDLDGNIMWSVLIDHGVDEGCLDAVIGEDGSVVVTGSVDDGVKRKVLVAQLDFNTGALVTHETIEMDLDAFGYTLAYRAQGKRYYLGGMQIADPADSMSATRGFVLSLKKNFTLAWRREITNQAGDFFTGVNDILVVPKRGLFVTGAYFNDNSVQGALSLLLRFNGTVKWDLSSSSSNSRHAGVEAYYERSNFGTLYLVSNNSVAHTFQITVIQQANGLSPSVASEYAVDLNVSSGAGINPAAFGVVPSRQNPHHMLVAGMYMAFDYSAMNTGNSPVFIARLDEIKGTEQGGNIYQLPNPGYATFGSPDLLDAFNLQQPLIYNPNSLVATPFGYVALGYRRLGERYNLEIIAVDGETLSTGTDCDRPLGNAVLGVGRNPDPVVIPAGPMTLLAAPFVDQLDLFLEPRPLCPAGGEDLGAGAAWFQAGGSAGRR